MTIISYYDDSAEIAQAKAEIAFHLKPYENEIDALRARVSDLERAIGSALFYLNDASNALSGKKDELRPQVALAIINQLQRSLTQVS